MRIKSEIKLNFDDVLLQPKRSTLTSRADVKMTRTFNFINSGKQLEFCPIFASNMDGVGTFSMAKEGLDIPSLDTLVLATPKGDVEQSVGRIQRPSETKKTPTVIDIVDSFSIFNQLRWKRGRHYTKMNYNVKTIMSNDDLHIL